MIAMPQQQSGNLAAALSLWNSFMQPGGSGAPAPNVGPGAPTGTTYDPKTDTDKAPGPTAGVAPDPSANVVPKGQSWNGTTPWFQPPQPNANGSITTQTPANPGNLGKAAGTASGIAGLLAAI